MFAGLIEYIFSFILRFRIENVCFHDEFVEIGRTSIPLAIHCYVMCVLIFICKYFDQTHIFEVFTSHLNVCSEEDFMKGCSSPPLTEQPGNVQFRLFLLLSNNGGTLNPPENSSLLRELLILWPRLHNVT